MLYRWTKTYSSKVIGMANKDNIARQANRLKKNDRETDLNVPMFEKEFSNLRDLGEYMEAQNKKLSAEIDGVRRELKTVILPAADNQCSLAWYDEELLNQLSTNEFGMDGTFSAKPALLKSRSSQLFTIMANVKGKVSTHLYL